MTTAILNFISSKIVNLDSNSRCQIIDIIAKKQSAIDTSMDITSLDIFSVLAIDEIAVQITEFIENYKGDTPEIVNDHLGIYIRDNGSCYSLNSLNSDIEKWCTLKNKAELAKHTDIGVKISEDADKKIAYYKNLRTKLIEYYNVKAKSN